MELYPGWSARDNYGYVSKKKKRKKDRSTADSGGIAQNCQICYTISYSSLTTALNFYVFFHY